MYYSKCCHAKIRCESASEWDGEICTNWCVCTACNEPCDIVELETNVVDKDLLAEGYEEMKDIGVEICTPELTCESLSEMKAYWDSELYAARRSVDWLKVWWEDTVRTFHRAKTEIIRFVERGRRGWSRADTWDLDCYLLDVIIGSVEQLNKDDPREDKKYRQDLHDICNTLKSVQNQYYEGLNTKVKVKQAQKQLNYAFRLLSKRFMQLWD